MHAPIQTEYSTVHTCVYTIFVGQQVVSLTGSGGAAFQSKAARTVQYCKEQHTTQYNTVQFVQTARCKIQPMSALYSKLLPAKPCHTNSPECGRTNSRACRAVQFYPPNGAVSLLISAAQCHTEPNAYGQDFHCMHPETGALREVQHNRAVQYSTVLG